MEKIFRWIKKNSLLLLNAGSLVGATLVTSILGFIYWWIAARRFSPEVVGIGSASISIMTLLGTFCIVGVGTLLITELPRQPHKATPLISTSLLVVALVGACVGILFALLAPMLSNQFSPLRENSISVLIFAAGVSLTAITSVLDQALIGLLRGTTQFARNALFAISKLIILTLISFILSHATGLSIYATWAGGNLLSLAVTVPLIFKRKRPLKSYFPQWKLLRQLGSTALQHHLLNITLQFPAYALPTVVTVLLSARMNALFYVSWMIVNFIFYIPAALTVVLHAMNSAHQASLATRARVTIGLALITSLLAIGLLEVITKQVLSVFGSSYVDGAATLRILVLAALPIIIKNHYVSICRIQDRVKSAMWTIGPGCILELGMATLGSHFYGLLGLSAGWVIAIYIEAILMSGTVYKAVWAPKASQDAEAEDLAGAGAIWLLDTALLPVLNSSPFSAVDTLLLPVVDASPLPVAKSNTYQLPPSWWEIPPSGGNAHRLKPARLQRLAPDTDPRMANASDVKGLAEEAPDKQAVLEQDV